jgi:hypothetical protein
MVTDIHAPRGASVEFGKVIVDTEPEPLVNCWQFVASRPKIYRQAQCSGEAPEASDRRYSNRRAAPIPRLERRLVVATDAYSLTSCR